MFTPLILLWYIRMSVELSEEQLQEVYAWIDQVPLSRAKKNITRDFSDGVLVAEVIKHFVPKMVDMHNYIPASSSQQKLGNWRILNRKVFSKLNFHVQEELVRRVISNTPGVIESVLYTLKQKISDRGHREGATLPGQEYYSTSMDGPMAATSPPYVKKYAYVGPTDQAHTTRPEGRSQPYAHLEPSLRLLLEEKDQELLVLKETVQILQMKVQRLEHLVQLKDLRIEDLTRHLKK